MLHPENRLGAPLKANGKFTLNTDELFEDMGDNL